MLDLVLVVCMAIATDRLSGDPTLGRVSAQLFTRFAPPAPHHPLAAKLKVNNEMKTSGPEPRGTRKPFTTVK